MQHRPRHLARPARLRSLPFGRRDGELREDHVGLLPVMTEVRERGCVVLEREVLALRLPLISAVLHGLLELNC